MKKLLIVVVIITSLSYWIAEPFGYIPFSKPDTRAFTNSNFFDCKNSIPNIEKRTQNTVIDAVNANQFLGISASAYKGGCGIFTASSGIRNKSSELYFKPDTISRIASITKPITAVAIMQLYEQGKLELDAPIQKYLPDFPVTASDLTIKHLLSHTAGITHYNSKLDALSFTEYSNLKLATQEIYKRDFVSLPGERYVYSSFGYTILGHIIEVITEQSYKTYVDENIFIKSGMVHTSFESSEWADDKSRLYLKVGQFFIKAPTTDLSIIKPAGGIQSTATDLMRFAQAILNNKLIKAETLAMMIDVTNSLAPAAGDDPSGLGWTVNEYPEFGRVISHSGSQPGASTFFQIFLDRNVATVSLSNAFGTKNSSRNLSFEMANIVLNHSD